MEKVTICKQEIAVGDQLILEIENWEVEKGLLFLGRKKLGENSSAGQNLLPHQHQDMGYYRLDRL